MQRYTKFPNLASFYFRIWQVFTSGFGKIIVELLEKTRNYFVKSKKSSIFVV